MARSSLKEEQPRRNLTLIDTHVWKITWKYTEPYQEVPIEGRSPDRFARL